MTCEAVQRALPPQVVYRTGNLEPARIHVVNLGPRLESMAGTFSHSHFTVADPHRNDTCISPCIFSHRYYLKSQFQEIYHGLKDQRGRVRHFPTDKLRIHHYFISSIRFFVDEKIERLNFIHKNKPMCKMQFLFAIFQLPGASRNSTRMISLQVFGIIEWR